MDFKNKIFTLNFNHPDIFFVLFFSALSYFNNTVFLPMSSKMFDFGPYLADVVPVAS